MAGLPRKYAKMGFAKGWRAYKNSKKTNIRSVKTMAKRRRRSSARTTYSRKRSSKMGGVAGLMLGGAGYGLIREPLNQLASKVPFVGSLGDEVVLLGASYLMATKGSGIIRKVGRAGLVIEAHNLARNLGGGLLGSITNATTPASSTSQSFR